MIALLVRWYTGWPERIGRTTAEDAAKAFADGELKVRDGTPSTKHVCGASAANGR
jgi:hypothetical protein